MEYREEGRGPTLVLVQSPIGAKKLAQAIPALRDFPYLEMLSLDGDNDYPALNWQKMAAKHFIQQLLTCTGWLHVRRAGEGEGRRAGESRREGEDRKKGEGLERMERVVG